MGPFVTLNLLWILKVNQIINSVVFLCKIITELGAVAQLGERVVRNDEVGGSNPPSSTSFSSDPIDLPLKDCPGAVRKGQ